MLSHTEENYLKGLLRLTMEGDRHEAGTNDLAAYLGIKPASVNGMLKKLKEKKLVNYQKYGKISLTSSGHKKAIEVVRRHRLWETFLYQKFAFSWDEIHEVAEQLEHIQSIKLVDRLDEFLGFPRYDPHGDPIPNAKGEMPAAVGLLLSNAGKGDLCTVVAVKDNSPAFLQYLQQIGIGLDRQIRVIAKHPYDDIMDLEVDKKPFSVGPKVAGKIVVTR